MRRQEEVTEQLRYKFTPDEHLENTRALVGKLSDAADLESTSKAVKANLKEREVACAAEVGRLARLVRDGFDVRAVRCRWDYGRPSENQKTLVRLDNGEDARTEMMLPHEKQEMLKFEEPSHVLAGPGSLKDKKVSDLADSDIEYYASRDPEELLKFSWIQADIDAVFAEAKKRADAKEGAAGNVTQMPAPSTGPELVVDNTSASSDPEKGPYDPPPCQHCAAGLPVVDTPFGPGHSLPDGSGVTCAPSVAAVSAAETPIEESNTLPSARAVDGPKRVRRSQSPAPTPTPEEREILEQLQAENAPIDPNDAPEV